MAERFNNPLLLTGIKVFSNPIALIDFIGSLMQGCSIALKAK
jgi:hypothetical protein